MESDNKWGVVGGEAAISGNGGAGFGGGGVSGLGGGGRGWFGGHGGVDGRGVVSVVGAHNFGGVGGGET